MKYQVFFFFFLGLLSLGSCTADNDVDRFSNEDEYAYMLNQYALSRQKTGDKVKSILSGLPGDETRGNDDCNVGDLLEYIVNIDSSYVDSLYHSDSRIGMNVGIDLYDPQMYAAVEQSSSVEEAAALYDFIEEYTSEGGNDMVYLYNSIQGMSKPTQNAMIESAYIIDNTITKGTLQIALHSSKAECIKKLEVSLIEDFVSDTLIDNLMIDLSMFPTLDLVVGLVDIGVDLTSAIKTAHDFELCCARVIN